MSLFVSFFVLVPKGVQGGAKGDPKGSPGSAQGTQKGSWGICLGHGGGEAGGNWIIPIPITNLPTTYQQANHKASTNPPPPYSYLRKKKRLGAKKKELHQKIKPTNRPILESPTDTQQPAKTTKTNRTGPLEFPRSAVHNASSTLFYQGTRF